MFGYGNEEPHVAHKKRPRIESPTKLRQVLNYSSSVDKVSDLLGVDAPTVYEIYKEQAEGEIQKRMLKNTPRNKRDSQKALLLLGHDPSKEKVKKTLGIDEESVHQVEEDIHKQNVLRLNTHQRRIETSPNKKKCAKALTTLGLDLSLYKATRLLGVDEETLRTVCHAEHAAQEDRARAARRRAQEDRLALPHDKKKNRKAFHIIGYDPSLEKVLSTLGVAAGTYEEARVGSILPVENRQREPALFPQATALVYALSVAILVVSSLRRNM